MKNNTFLIEIFVTLGFGVICLAIVAVLLAFTNPKLEEQCAAKGGQVLVRPGHLSSCLYPAK